MKRLILSAAVLALSSACATTGANTGVRDIKAGSEAQLFADYLIGSYANYVDDADNRARYYSRAFAIDGTPELGRRAVTSAITAGDTDDARKLSLKILADKVDEPMARAVLGAKAFSQSDYKKAIKYLGEETDDLTVKIMMDIMRGWSQKGLGDPAAGKVTLSNLSGGAYFQVLGKVLQANMDGIAGDVDSALNSYALADASSVAPTETALSQARLLSQSGDIQKALEGLKTFNEDNGNFDTGPIKSYLNELEAGQPISQTLSPQQEAAWALTEAAYGFFLRNRAVDVAEVYIRTALVLDPNNDKSKIWLAAILEETNRQDEALALYKAVTSESPYAVSARLSEANVYFDRDQDATAISILETANQNYPSFTTRESLGRARLIRENYAEALPIYDALVNSMSEEDLKADIQPLYFRGICYEREKQWENAVADFKRVLELEPENADALNYLGYTWVDRNENLTEAFAMIEKAVELEPQSGAILDSLGWAHYKLGHYTQARLNLESAVELTPNSATIIDHLGDVYWKVGRFREAGFQWERALEYDPTDEERDSIKAKLKDGLSAGKTN